MKELINDLKSVENIAKALNVVEINNKIIAKHFELVEDPSIIRPSTTPNADIGLGSVYLHTSNLGIDVYLQYFEEGYYLTYTKRKKDQGREAGYEKKLGSQTISYSTIINQFLYNKLKSFYNEFAE